MTARYNANIHRRNPLAFLTIPHLPDSPVLAAAAGQAFVCRDLARLGVRPLLVPPCRDLAAPVQSHADMLLHHLGGPEVAVHGYSSRLVDSLSAFGLHPRIGSSPLTQKYPGDVAYNFCRLGNRLAGNFKRAKPEQCIADYCAENGVIPLHTNQGYAKCSVCILDERAVITADPSIARRLSSEGIAVLKIRPGFIRLDGYSTGFLGGCCGKLAPGLLYFTGKLSSHPDGEEIRAFAAGRGVGIVEGERCELVDVGGILPLIQS